MKNTFSLIGTSVRLEPLSFAHAEGLWAAGQHPLDWQFLPRGCFKDIEDVQNWIAEAQIHVEKGEHVAFTIFNNQTNEIVGSTRYLAIRPYDHVLEIGWTWLAPQAQRSRINTEMKFLMLQHAFEELNMRRVELKTDLRNSRSQRAIERLGAVKEGIFRKHMRVQNDFQRDTVFYSVIDDEWSAVKEKLLERLA